MNRRKFISLIPVSTCTAVTVGCLGFQGTGGVDVTVRNSHSETHSYEITAKGDFQPNTRSGTLPPDDSGRFEGFIPRLDYEHTPTLRISIDGRQVRKTNLLIRSDLQEMTITITGTESVEIRPNNIHSTSGTPEP